MEQAKWYIVATQSNYEKKVSTNLEKVIKNRNLSDMIQQIKVITKDETVIADGKKKTSNRKVYPGYVFLKMIHTDETWAVVRGIRGVKSFAGPGGIPTPLSDKDVKKIGLEDDVVITATEFPYKVGELIKIVGTNMDGFTGTIQEIDIDNNKVVVIVHMFGKETPIDLELTNITSVDE